jgi:hypothetical protein
MEFDRVLSKIRGLIAKAESLEQSGDPDQLNEALACRNAADRMMQAYAVEDWQARQAAPVASKPDRIKIKIGDADSLFLGEMAGLVNIVSQFCKCSSVWMVGGGKYTEDKQEFCYVYGYESDLRYFEMLFTSLFLHMNGAIFPKPDPAKTLTENVYELHNAGMNWLDIAAAYGWYQVNPIGNEPLTMFVNRNTGERVSWHGSVGIYKKAYVNEIKRKGEPFFRIAPNGSATYRRNAAQGYLARINQRLREIAGHRGSGAELVLADKSQNITALINEHFGDLKSMSSKKTTYVEAAYRNGVRHANSAALNPQASGPRTSLS